MAIKSHSEQKIIEKFKLYFINELKKVVDGFYKNGGRKNETTLVLGTYGDLDLIEGYEKTLTLLKKEKVIEDYNIFPTEQPPIKIKKGSKLSKLQEAYHRDELIDDFLEQQNRMRGFDEDDFPRLKNEPVFVANIQFNPSKLKLKLADIQKTPLIKLATLPTFKNNKLLLDKKILVDFTPKRGNPASTKYSKIFNVLYKDVQVIEENKKTTRKSASIAKQLLLKDLATMSGSNSAVAVHQSIKRLRKILENNNLPIHVYSSLKTGFAQMAITVTV